MTHRADELVGVRLDGGAGGSRGSARWLWRFPVEAEGTGERGTRRRVSWWSRLLFSSLLSPAFLRVAMVAARMHGGDGVLRLGWEGGKGADVEGGSLLWVLVADRG